ncbi:MAG TPA: hypothetical protein VFZ00_00600 [Solirubrobacter sp.]|nr:hypothetical protein [Solirubrobacter sp.]
MNQPLDLLVGVTWMVVALVVCSRQRTRASAVLAGAFGATWLLGDLDPALLFLHRGPLAHLLLAYPTGRLGSLRARAAVATAYVAGIAAGQGDAAEWTLAFAAGLLIAVSIRWFSATGVVRRSRLIPLIVACAVGAVLAVGAATQADVLVVYELVLVLAGVAVALDLRAARWSQSAIAGLMVDLGRRPVGGVVRERLARALGDPTLTVAYVVDGSRAPVDEHGRPVDLPQNGGSVVTPVDLGGRTVALLIHDPVVLADGPLISGAASALSVSLGNARLQAEVRGRVADVEASTRRLLDAADSERRRLGSDLRAQVDPLLQQAAKELGSEPALLARLDDVRHQLFRLAAGLDPITLHDGGLEPALRELADHAGLPTSVSVEAGPFPPAVESCVWFTCAEAMANAHKHAYATRLDISVRRSDGVLRVEVADDGVGGADPNGGSGLRRLAERVRSAGGQLNVDSRRGHGTRVLAELELGVGP